MAHHLAHLTQGEEQLSLSPRSASCKVWGKPFDLWEESSILLFKSVTGAFRPWTSSGWRSQGPVSTLTWLQLACGRHSSCGCAGRPGAMMATTALAPAVTGQAVWDEETLEGNMGRHLLWRATAFGLLILLMFLSAQHINAQWALTTDQPKLPSANPPDVSKGYGFKAPDQADENGPRRWEAASCMLTRGFITLRQGDTVTVNAPVMNGDQHQVLMTAPDGQVVVPTVTWHRGRQSRVSFVTDQVGLYRLNCVNHAPMMTAAILVLPR